MAERSSCFAKSINRMALGFVSTRNRDAWAAIRGFVYQVDTTIGQWLDLAANEWLELEGGEDVDKISHIAESPDRLLEQVKHLTTPLSLRSPAAVAAVANFAEHRNTNPQVLLRFCFLTTAPIGFEKGMKLPGGHSGIGLWERIRCGVDPQSSMDEADSLRKLLAGSSQPRDIPDQTWNTFRGFIDSATQEEWLDFVRHFQWNTQQPDDQFLENNTISKLQGKGHAQTTEQAKQQYDRLFVYVFKLLSARGPKLLTPKDLSQQLGLPELTTKEADELSALVSWRESVEQRLSSVEQGLSAIQRIVVEKALGVDSPTFSRSTYPPILDVPPLVAVASPRTSTVLELYGSLEQSTWLALSGMIGIGKTHLAILLAQHNGKCLAWLRLRDLDEESALVVIQQAIEHLHGSAQYPLQPFGEVVSSVFERAPESALVVLDDLPRLLPGSRLSNILVLLVQAAARSGAHLISTSAHEIAESIGEYFQKGQVASVSCPGLTDDEVSEILELYGAPREVRTDKIVKFLNLMARQHPVLLASIIQLLKDREWIVDSGLIDSLIQGDFGANSQNATIYRVIKAVVEPSSRDLLQRCCVFASDFAINDLLEISAVEPAIDHPRERLEFLTGLWIQRDRLGQYRLSPLVHNVGPVDQEPAVVRQCHLAAARCLSRKKKLSLGDASALVMHLARGESYDSAAAVLAGALHAWIDLSPSRTETLLLSIWYDVPLPKRMSLGMQIHLRGAQIMAAFVANRPTHRLMAEFEALIAQATDREAWAVLSGVSSAGRFIAETDFARSLALLTRALRLVPNGKMPDGSPLAFAPEMDPAFFVWIISGQVASRARLEAWLKLIDELPSETWDVVFKGEMGLPGSVELADRFWIREAEKPIGDRDWLSLVRLFDYLESRALAYDQQFLATCAVRAKIVVLADYLDDLNGAEAVFENAIQESKLEKRSQFLLNEVMGRQYLYHGDMARAAALLEKALTNDTPELMGTRLQTLLAANRAFGSINAAKALSYAKAAVALAVTAVDVAPISCANTFCELAIAEWQCGSLLLAYRALDRGLELMLDNRTDTDAWKDKFVLLGHVATYLLNEAQSGPGHPIIREGEPLAAPTRGLFSQVVLPARVALFRNDHEAIVILQMATYAQAVEDYERMGYWAERALGVESTGDSIALQDLRLLKASHQICNRQYVEALDTETGRHDRDFLATHDSVRPQQVAHIEIGGSIGATTDTKHKGLVGSFSLLAIALHLHWRSSCQGEAVEDAVGTLIDQCQFLSNSGSQSRYWKLAADVTRWTFLGEETASELVDSGNSEKFREYPDLVSLCYLGASAKRDLTIAQVAHIHLSIWPFIWQTLPSTTMLYRKVALPFLSEYWKLRLRKSRIMFGSPSILEAEFADSEQVPYSTRAQVILEGLIMSLSLPKSNAVTKWLTETRSKAGPSS